jgi:hypothetical protein
LKATCFLSRLGREELTSTTTSEVTTGSLLSSSDMITIVFFEFCPLNPKGSQCFSFFSSFRMSWSRPLSFILFGCVGVYIYRNYISKQSNNRLVLSLLTFLKRENPDINSLRLFLMSNPLSAQFPDDKGRLPLHIEVKKRNPNIQIS